MIRRPPIFTRTATPVPYTTPSLSHGQVDSGVGWAASPLAGYERTILPLGGRGTMRSMVEGHARCFLPYPRRDSARAPPPPLGWSPSPLRGGAAPPPPPTNHSLFPICSISSPLVTRVYTKYSEQGLVRRRELHMLR